MPLRSEGGMTIPADIQKAAAAVYAQLGRGPDADEQVIAKALMAERGAAVAWLIREAQINDELADQIVGSDGRDWHKHFASVQRQNAEAVRHGQHVKRAAAILTPHPSPTSGA